MYEETATAWRWSAMSLALLIALSLGLGVLALIGLLAVAKELLRERLPDGNFGAERAMDRNDLGCAHGRRRPMTP
jgi:hypothetical protein